VRFVVTPKVYEEIISKPSGSRRFALESMRIQRLITSGAVVVQSSGSNLRDRILGAANRVYRIKGRELKIIHPAEAEAIALAGEIEAEALMVDERTTRLLMENPYELKELLSYRNRVEVVVDESWLRKLKDILPNVPVIRSAELIAVAYERGLLTRMYDVEDKRVFEAALAALKFSGCAISWDEIGEYQKAVI
jgi:predicted nucleic acid-binding protein